MKYLLLFCHDEHDAPGYDELPPDAQRRMYEAVTGWQKENQACLIDPGNRLAPSSMATTVRRKEGGTVVTDGPFVEGKEVVAGYVVIDVADLDEALRVATTFPACPTVEIRPISGM